MGDRVPGWQRWRAPTRAHAAAAPLRASPSPGSLILPRRYCTVPVPSRCVPTRPWTRSTMRCTRPSPASGAVQRCAVRPPRLALWPCGSCSLHAAGWCAGMYRKVPKDAPCGRAHTTTCSCRARPPPGVCAACSRLPCASRVPSRLGASAPQPAHGLPALGTHSARARACAHTLFAGLYSSKPWCCNMCNGCCPSASHTTKTCLTRTSLHAGLAAATGTTSPPTRSLGRLGCRSGGEGGRGEGAGVQWDMPCLQAKGSLGRA